MLLPAARPPVDLAELAARAMDAARTANVSYADIRVAERHHLSVGLGESALDASVTFGVRVLVDGAWAFSHGTRPSADAVADAARDAIATARGYAKIAPVRAEIAPAPVVTGEWVMPIEVDPFTVPLQDQAALIRAYTDAGARVRHGIAFGRLQWTRETRAFASTDGSYTTQRVWRSVPFFIVGAKWGSDEFGGVSMSVPELAATSGGYETVARTGIQERIKQLAEWITPLALLPQTTLDVGRYPVVFDGAPMGALLGQTLGGALELDRALGEEADAGGTSYLAPPEAMLGTAIASSLLSVTGQRDMVSVSAVKWDDDGVVARPFSVLENGVAVDYFTSRRTAPALRSFYEQRGIPLRSNGCAIASQGGDAVLTSAPHLTVTPGRQGTTVDDLCRDIARGVFVLHALYVAVDHQFASGSLFTSGNVFMFELERGKPVRRLRGNALQFGTARLWRSLAALGDATTVRNCYYDANKGYPWRQLKQSGSAPAALFKDVNVASSVAQL
jgi:TldD protein